LGEKTETWEISRKKVLSVGGETGPCRRRKRDDIDKEVSEEESSSAPTKDQIDILLRITVDHSSGEKEHREVAGRRVCFTGKQQNPRGKEGEREKFGPGLRIVLQIIPKVGGGEGTGRASNKRAGRENDREGTTTGLKGGSDFSSSSKTLKNKWAHERERRGNRHCHR